MARLFLTPIDLNGLELRGAVIGNLPTASIDAITSGAGRIQYDSSLNVLKYRDNAGWKTISTSAGTVTSVAGTSGRITASGTTSVTLDLAANYGDNLNPYASKSANTILAAPNGSTGVPTFRALAAADIPSTLNATIFSGAVAMGTYRITGVGDPSAAQDAATKAYVDTIATGINAHEAVSYASTAEITGTYSNGVSGVGATLTGTGSLVIDGYTVVSGDAGTNVQGGTGLRVLLKNQTTNTDQNGIYTVTACVSTTSWTLTRAYDYDALGEVAAGDFTYVLLGSANAKFTFVQTSKPAAISGVGTTANAITFGVFANGNISGTVAVNQGGTGQTTFTSNGVLLGNAGSALNVTAAGTADQVLRIPGAGGAPAFGAIDLSKSAAVTGLLSPTNGGTGVNNGSKTITLSGSATIGSNTDTVQFTTAGNTNVTLPTTGTLLTAAGAVTSVNGSVGAVSNIAVTNAANTFTGTQTVQAAATQDSVKVAGRAGGTSSYAVTLTPATLNGSVTLTLPSSQAAQGFTLARTLTGTVTVASGTGTITHNMNNQYVLVQIFDNSTNALVDMDVTLATANTVTVAATTDATYRYVIIG